MHLATAGTDLLDLTTSHPAWAYAYIHAADGLLISLSLLHDGTTHPHASDNSSNGRLWRQSMQIQLALLSEILLS